MSVLFRGGSVFTDQRFQILDLRIDDEGKVQLGGPRGPLDPLPGEKVIDLDGKYILPGLADIHVHLREPGFEYKETVATGTAAAAHGGFTALGVMPNVAPPPDNLPELLAQIQTYQNDSEVFSYPYATITKGGTGRGEPVDYRALWPQVIGFSDDGFGVQDEETMRQCMRGIAAVGGILAEHIEDLELAGDGYIHDGQYAAEYGHKGKSGESEWKQLERDLRLVAETGCRYHACHLSTAESVELVRAAKAAGLPVTAETAPHYLGLSDDMLEEDGRFRMNPPIRPAKDRQAVLDGLADGTIDMIATDHAPHSAAEKAAGLAGSANGIVGLEHSLLVSFTELVRSGRITMADLVRLMCTAPRAVFELGGGEIVDGEPADLIVFDADHHAPLDTDTFLSKGRATPFAGRDLYGRVELTMCQGDPVWDATGIYA